tara:strand:- start:234 stop:596 length:363 start_codon:yes stop_codon:yes gene_type:complete
MAFKMKGWSPYTKGKTSKRLDKAQSVLSAAGMVPGVGNVADLANTAISGARAIGAKIKGDKKAAKRHAVNAALNAGAMIPVVGQTIGTVKQGVEASRKLKNIKNKNIAKKRTKKQSKNIG